MQECMYAYLCAHPITSDYTNEIRHMIVSMYAYLSIHSYHHVCALIHTRVTLTYPCVDMVTLGAHVFMCACPWLPSANASLAGKESVLEERQHLLPAAEYLEARPSV